MAKYKVKCDVTTFYEIEVEALDAGSAWDQATQIPIEKWSANNAESTMCDLEDVEQTRPMPFIDENKIYYSGGIE